MSQQKISAEVAELNAHFRAMVNHRNGSLSESPSAEAAKLQPSAYHRMVNDTEMYYGDVEKTNTQFTVRQLNQIKERYDVPISSKMNYAIGEQIISHLVGAKPFPKVVASSGQEKDAAELYEKLFHAFWYESAMDGEYIQATGDNVQCGQGWLHVRPDDFYGETTFGIIGEHMPWEYVYVDHTCIRRDLKDADIVCIARRMMKDKFERKHGVTINNVDEDLQYLCSWAQLTMEGDAFNVMDSVGMYDDNVSGKKDTWKVVFERIFYRKEMASIYVSENDDLGKKKPVPMQLPNRRKAELQMQLDELQAQGRSIVESLKVANEQALAGEEATISDALPDAGMEAMQQGQQAFGQQQQQAEQILQQVQAIEREMAELPDTEDGFEMETLSKEIVQVYSVQRIQRKVVRRTVLGGNRIILNEILPIDEFPLVPLTMTFLRGFNRTFGITHFVKDIVKAINKFWSLMIYDLQIHSVGRLWVPEGSVVDTAKLEQDWSKAGAVMSYTPNPSLPNGGKPEEAESRPMAPGLRDAIALLGSMAEYSSGISPMMQGQVEGLPDAAGLGGIQSIHAMATQRLKLYALQQEQSMQMFAYVTIAMLQHYAPKDKVLAYLDENGDRQEVQILKSTEDVRFKVRVSIAPGLSTSRQMAAQVLASVSGQTKNPVMADVLTKAFIENSDIPGGHKIAAQMDTLNQLQSQNEQLRQEVTDSQKAIVAANKKLQDMELQMMTMQSKLQIEHATDLRLEQLKMADDEKEASIVGRSVGSTVANVTTDNEV